MHEPAFLRFASDATFAALWAGACLILALSALIAERRRLKRRRIDSVGWVPWTGIFMAASFAAATLLLIALKGWAGA
ncbi:hypothetical protein [Altererythrobacter sp. B11]|uniref:hypothetical protein n=1 Tax=Altererythrobacter sp. B11 TaxID=2060312 RepID=UPI000E5BE0D6|nr:hypothetical protein [Altererythrobacter sp. B11]